jgi:hypothetical protein
MVAGDMQQPGLDEEGLLEGWKAIADHLNKTERTVQRWEKSKGLPVRRLKAGSPEEQGRVFAYKTELDAWWKEILTRPDVLVETPDPEVLPLRLASFIDSQLRPTPDPKPRPPRRNIRLDDRGRSDGRHARPSGNTGPS